MVLLYLISNCASAHNYMPHYPPLQPPSNRSQLIRTISTTCSTINPNFHRLSPVIISISTFSSHINDRIKLNSLRSILQTTRTRRCTGWWRRKVSSTERSRRHRARSTSSQPADTLPPCAIGKTARIMTRQTPCITIRSRTVPWTWTFPAATDIRARASCCERTR